MRTDLFNYSLPERLIARHPAPVRDASRLLVLRRSTGVIEHHRSFREILDFLRPGDVLVLNNSRVFPARLRGRKEGSGGAIELLLLEKAVNNEWWTLLRPGKRVRSGTRIELLRGAAAAGMTGEVREKDEEGHCLVRFSGDIAALAETIGQVPLPPYIDRAADETDRERYQTVFAVTDGSVAAPTAGLHFTHELLGQIALLGVEAVYVTLHVGLGTFAPVKAEALEDHPMHEERFVIDASAAAAINAARQSGRRIIAVGTTTVRVLEAAAAAGGGILSEMTGRTRIFIYPPFRFQVVDALITNFHLPQSTLLMLVGAFASPGKLSGRELVMAAYAEAVRLEYRFFSYGDAMLIA